MTPSDPIVVTVVPGPAQVVPNLVDASDTGRSNTDNITKITTPVFDGTTTAGNKVELFDGGISLGSVVAGADGKWSIASPALTPGVHYIRSVVTDSQGYDSGLSSALQVTVDTSVAAPAGLALTAASDTGISSTDRITNAAKPTITGVAEPGASVAVYDGGVLVGQVQAAIANGAWSFTYATSPAQGVRQVTAIATDIAGNVSVSSAALSYTLDQTPPGMLPNVDLAAASDTGISNTDNVTNAAMLTFTGTGAEPGASVRVTMAGVQIGIATAAADGSWSVTGPFSGQGNNMTVSVWQTDVAGNSNAGITLQLLRVTVDRTAPAAPTALDLTASSDSGSSATDNVTNVTKPTITGKAEAGSTVTLYDGETIIGTAVADASGVWSVVTSVLEAGVHNLTAKAADAAGNASAASAVLAVTVDVTPDAAPSAPDLQAASDSGVSNTDNITNATGLVFTGNGAAAGATVRLYADTVLAGSAVADGSGNWSITATGVADGSGISFTTEQVDAAGNVSARSEALAVTVDRTAPSAPAALDLTAASDSGDVNTDNLTRVTTPTITG
ncbi:Ig-like domain-containing protein, partial [Pseudoduganella ginsengisoli]